MLTQRQLQLLRFLHKYVHERGCSPSFDEMRSAMKLRSKSGVHRLITGLEERGFIKRLPHRARAIELLKPLPGTEQIGGVATKAVDENSNVVRGEFGTSPRPVVDQPAIRQVPLVGRIAAGTPIEALADNNTTLEVPAMLMGDGEHYVVQVVGDSMMQAGIVDGDYAVIERGETAESGAIVVALVEGREVTLKRLRKRGNSIALEPANPDYEVRIFGPNQVQVQGRLVGLLRRY